MMSQVLGEMYIGQEHVMFLVFVYINDCFPGHCGIVYAVIAVQYEF